MDLLILCPNLKFKTHFFFRPFVIISFFVFFFWKATRPVPKARTEESILEEEEAEMGPDAEKREQAIAKRADARKVRDNVQRVGRG